MDISSIPLAVDQLFWSRPNLAMLRVFNLAAYALTHHKQPSLAVVSSSLYAIEIIKRAPYPLSLAGSGTFDPHRFTELMASWSWGDIHPIDITTDEKKYANILWAQPLKESADEIITCLEKLAERGCNLNVVIFPGGWQKWAKVLVTGNVNTVKPKDVSLHPGDTMELLKGYGWQVDTVISFNGARTAFWRLLGKSFNRLNLLLWSDRCYQMMRIQLREPAWLWPLAHTVLIRARLA